MNKAASIIETEQFSRVMWIIIIVVILVTAVFAGVGIYLGSKKPGQRPCVERTDCPECIKEAPGIWVSAEGNFSLEEAQEYCKSQGGILAHHEQIIRAGTNNNLRTCQAGWFQDLGGDSAIGRYVHNKEACGANQEGWQVLRGVRDKYTRGAAFCQARLIPGDRSVADIAIAR